MVMSVMVDMREHGVHIGRQYTHVSGIAQVKIVINFGGISQS
jgi:hypothetical protein